MPTTTNRLLAANGNALTQANGGHIYADAPAPAITSARVTQVVVESIHHPIDQKLRVTQTGVEVIFSVPKSLVCVTQLGVEVLALNIFLLDISPKNFSTIVGRPVQYSAISLNDIGQRRLVNVTWACEAASGTIDANGLYMPTASGVHSITATEAP